MNEYYPISPFLLYSSWTIHDLSVLQMIKRLSYQATELLDNHILEAVMEPVVIDHCPKGHFLLYPSWTTHEGSVWLLRGHDMVQRHVHLPADNSFDRCLRCVSDPHPLQCDTMPIRNTGAWCVALLKLGVQTSEQIFHSNFRHIFHGHQRTRSYALRFPVKI